MKKNHLLRSAVIMGGMLLAAPGAKAQMTGTDVFLHGKYVEVGIGHLGYYGSDGDAPSVYHTHFGVSPAHLGFVADPDSTDWSTGTPHYMGDYFLPGSPFEGWNLQVDTNRCQAANFNLGAGAPFVVSAGMPACTGSNLSYTATGSRVSGTWQGMVDSVQVTQVTSLDTNDLFFTVKVTLTNMAVAPKDNIYYFRTLDPDNDETWTGGAFTTHNKIEHQLPGPANAAVVSATGVTSPDAYLSLGTGDTSARAIIYYSWPLAITQDLGAVYNGTATGIGTAFYAEGDSTFLDDAIGLIIKVPHLATVDSSTDSVHRTTAEMALHPANSASFSYFYAFSRAAETAAINATKPDTMVTSSGTLSINNVNTTTEIKVYPNPAKNIINVTGLTATDQLSLYDMMGRTVNQNWTAGNKSVNTFSLNGIPAGAYILMVQDANGNMKARMPIRKQ